MHTGSALTKHTTVRELVAAFSDAERRTRAAFAEILDIENALNGVFALGEDMRRIRIDATWSGNEDDFENADRCIERMRRSAWRVVVDRLELRRALSVKRYEQLQRQIDTETPPAITEENVEAFVRQYANDLPELLTEAVREVFEWLRPRRNRRGHRESGRDPCVGEGLARPGRLRAQRPSSVRTAQRNR